MTQPISNIVRLKQWMVERLQGFVDPSTIPDRSPETLNMLNARFAELCRQAQLQLSAEQARQLFAQVAADIVGYGPLDQFLTDDDVFKAVS